VADYHNIIYFKGPNSLYVNLYVPSAVTWEYDGGTGVGKEPFHRGSMAGHPRRYVTRTSNVTSQY
jgi:hypothetical protein